MRSYFASTPNWTYSGKSLGNQMKQNTYEDCCAQCSKRPNCEAITWFRKTCQCHLYSSVGSSGKPHTFADSGRRLGNTIVTSSVTTASTYKGN
ncbi:unnamed protein product, partial [Didymodactylos carnosus]